MNMRGAVNHDYQPPAPRRNEEEPMEEKMRKNMIFANLVEALQFQLALKRSALDNGAPIEVVVDGIEEEEKEPREEVKQPLI